MLLEAVEAGDRFSVDLEARHVVTDALLCVGQQLLQHGAILFRNFRIEGPEGFEKFVRAVTPHLLDYNERVAPRLKVADNIYTSTEFPADQYIPLHHEMSYSHNWPLKIWFGCLTAPEVGGRTPIADCRSVLEHLDPRLVQEFAHRGVSYLRNLRRGIGLSWQETFQTQDPAEVRRYCSEARIEIELFEADRLRTRQRRHAVAHHHATRAATWFNQAHLFHTHGLDPAVADSLRRTYAEEDLPRHAYFGDGAAIPDGVIDDILQAYRKAEVSFAWQRGDVMLLDNMLVAHARTPFSGPRLIMPLRSPPAKNVFFALVMTTPVIESDSETRRSTAFSMDCW